MSPRVWIYALKSSSDPDCVRCVVPWRIDNKLIYFGPCKIRIRERLRKEFLSEACDHADIRNDLYIVGVNGSNGDRVRKVVWAGKLAKVMTFAEAHSRLTGERFRKMRSATNSPLHVRPLRDSSGRLTGYEHRSDEHIEKNCWIQDLTSDSARVRLSGRRIQLRTGTVWDAFDRDCCMLIQNLLFAEGEGIPFDTKSVGILRKAQPDRREGIDQYSIFGLAGDGRANGLRGSYLELEGDLAGQFITWIADKSRKVRTDSLGESRVKSCTPKYGSN